MLNLIKGLELWAQDPNTTTANRQLAQQLIEEAKQLAIGWHRLFQGSQQAKFIGFQTLQGRWLAREVDSYHKVANP